MSTPFPTRSPVSPPGPRIGRTCRRRPAGTGTGGTGDTAAGAAVPPRRPPRRRRWWHPDRARAAGPPRCRAVLRPICCLLHQAHVTTRLTLGVGGAWLENMKGNPASAAGSVRRQALRVAFGDDPLESVLPPDRTRPGDAEALRRVEHVAEHGAGRLPHDDLGRPTSQLTVVRAPLVGCYDIVAAPVDNGRGHRGGAEQGLCLSVDVVLVDQAVRARIVADDDRQA